MMFHIGSMLHSLGFTTRLSFHRYLHINTTLFKVEPAKTRPIEEVRNQHGKVLRVSKENVRLETFYSAQKVCPSQEEFSVFLDSLRTPLPQSFRINEARQDEVRRIMAILESPAFSQLAKPIDPMKLSWQFKTDRWSIRANVDHVQKFLETENFLGNISRQELVSQVPVKLLDIQPHHRVLDMCASPGSKTKQVVSALHASCPESIPTGFVVANEVSPNRCFRLWQNLKQVNSPCALMVHHDGRTFPEIFLTNDGDGGGGPIRYDRIVCDQPCSGDGTIRKNPNVWTHWAPMNGHMVHNVQYHIARRGLELLKVDGLFAYSSCAMNPIENEAVIDHLLHESEGAFEVLNLHDQLSGITGLKCYEGLTDWKVLDPNLTAYERFEDTPEVVRKRYLFERSQFPVRGKFSNQLRFGMRFLPHLNNDGGFFVAILRKTAEMPWERRQGGSVSMFRQKIKTHISEWKGKGFERVFPNKDSFHFLDDPKRKKISEDLEFLGTDTNVIHPGLFYENTPKADYTAHFVTENVKDIIESNRKRRVNILNAGVNCFAKNQRQKSGQHFQLNKSDGPPFLLPHLSDKRLVTITRDDFERLLDKNVAVNEDELSQVALNSVKQLSGIGTVKIRIQSDNSKSLLQNLQVLGFLGEMMLLLDICSKQRIHLKRVLELE